jgi:uncharacterized protein
MQAIRSGLSLMLEDEFLQASLPLFESGEVDVIEWSFDVGWSRPALPEWVEALLGEYSRAGSLVGHGVTFSALSGEWTERAERWLDHLRGELNVRKYLHISEHFGFMAAGNFHQGTPLPVPLTEHTLRLGRARMRALAEVAGCPVGLENLALALSMRDVTDQGVFLRELLEAVDGFLVLDLHNVYCQMMNFDRSAKEILSSYPLERVREMHISGGSWMEAVTARGGPIRRDTHDDDVPEEVFGMLKEALPLCPQTEVVIFERLGYTLADPKAQDGMRNDFMRMKSIVSGHE